MRLAEFIADNMEVILAEWEAFAASVLPSGAGMTSLVLRDHAPQILDAVVKDITTAQTPEAQAEKSKGRAPRVQGSPAPVKPWTLHLGRFFPWSPTCA